MILDNFDAALIIKKTIFTQKKSLCLFDQEFYHDFFLVFYQDFILFLTFADSENRKYNGLRTIQILS